MFTSRQILSAPYIITSKLNLIRHKNGEVKAGMQGNRTYEVGDEDFAVKFERHVWVGWASIDREVYDR